jgi:hypothetical protein
MLTASLIEPQKGKNIFEETERVFIEGHCVKAEGNI